MKKTKFKEGDWCFCEYKLQKIMEIKDGRITQVNDSTLTMSGNNLSDRCYPLDLKIKMCSDLVEYWSRKFHELNRKNINYPDLNRELVRRWVEMCDNVNDANVFSNLHISLIRFGNDVIENINEAMNKKVDGIPLFYKGY